MRVYFVGAGPGDPELMTVKARRLLGACRICIYAGSLISAAVLNLIPDCAERHDSANLDLEEITALFRDAYERNIDVVRLHSGDPSIYGAIGEQIRELSRLAIDYEVVPGVSSFQAAAAALRCELTAPETSQTIILTRTSGRTPVPEEQELEALGKTRATLCIFLSAHKMRVVAQTLERDYGSDCPAAVVYRASWPDQQIIRGTLADIADKTGAAGIKKTAMIVVGRALSGDPPASKLYDPGFSHGYRTAKDSRELSASPKHEDDPAGPTFLHCAPTSGQASGPLRPVEVLEGAGRGRAFCRNGFLGSFQDENPGIAVITLSKKGAILAERLGPVFSRAHLYVHDNVAGSWRAERFCSVKDLVAEIFHRYHGLVFIAPCGVALRAIASHIEHKSLDPAVVVVDAGGRWAVSLLSGHEGCANDLAVAVGNILFAEPVITTTTEAVKNVIVGLGYRKETGSKNVVTAVISALDEAGLELAQVRLLSSVEIKAGEEGLFAAAQELGTPLRFISFEEIVNFVKEFQHSAFAEEEVRSLAVAEPVALLAGRSTKLVLGRRTYNGVTVALAQEDCLW